MHVVLHCYRPLLAATVVILAAAVLSVEHSAHAQSSAAEALVIPRLDTPIELDGRIEEPAWRKARALQLVQNKPVFGAEPTEKTEVLIGYSDGYVYAACRCYDRGTPLAPSFKRDFAGWSDSFGLIFDTFNDNENAVGFYTTPTGLRLDLVVKDDATDNSPLDIDWNTVWDVEVHQNEEGWFAEMRIPISSLRRLCLVAERALAAPKYDGINLKPKFVHQPGCKQLAHHIAATMRQ